MSKLDSSGDECYPPGEILDGFSLDVIIDSEWNQYAVSPADDPPSTVVGPNDAFADTKLSFHRADAVGFDLSEFAFDGVLYSIAVLGPGGNLVGEFLFDPPDYPSSEFIGIRAGETIEHIIVSHQGFGAEVIDNLTFGMCVRDVMIDVKPGSDPNSINCRATNGVITVAVLTTSDFDATTIDHTTLVFEGASETHLDRRSGEPRRHEEDVDGDGDLDLVLHVRLGETDLGCSATEGVLTGNTYDGASIRGMNTVRVIH